MNCGEEGWKIQRTSKVPGHGHANLARFHSTCSSGCSGAALAWPGNSAHVSGPGCRIRDVGFDSALAVPMLRGRMSAHLFFFSSIIPIVLHPLSHLIIASRRSE